MLYPSISACRWAMHGSSPCVAAYAPQAFSIKLASAVHQPVSATHRSCLDLSAATSMQCAQCCFVLLKSSMQHPQRSRTAHGSNTWTVRQIIHSDFLSLLQSLFILIHLLSSCLFTHSIVHPRFRPLIHSLIHSAVHPFIHLSIQPAIHSLTHSLTHSVTTFSSCNVCSPAAQPQQPSSKDSTLLRFATC